MCYTEDIRYKGIQIIISNCFGAGFNWNDENLKTAVESRSEDIWEIMNWIVNGGAKLYNDAMEFDLQLGRTYSEALYVLYRIDTSDIRKNPYATKRTKKLIEMFDNGDLVDEASKQKEEEKRNNTNHKKDKKSGYVYLVGCENGLFKIGKSKNVNGRVNEFGVKFPIKTWLIHSFKASDYSQAESSLHERYNDKRKHGEWFSLSQEEVESICSIRDGEL